MGTGLCKLRMDITKLPKAPSLFKSENVIEKKSESKSESKSKKFEMPKKKEFIKI